MILMISWNNFRLAGLIVLDVGFCQREIASSSKSSFKLYTLIGWATKSQNKNKKPLPGKIKKSPIIQSN